MIRQWGLTLMELLLGIAIIGVLVAIAIPSYEGYIEKTRRAQAISDIRAIEVVVDSYFLDFGTYPPNLAAVDMGGMEDPWGNPYQYTNFSDTPKGKWRKDRNLVPINTDYDLYSMGPDGQSVPPMTAKHSRDDIVRANDGGFVGLAEDY